jgi:hypothetical protein
MVAAVKVLKESQSTSSSYFRDILSIPPGFFQNIPVRLIEERQKRDSGGKPFFNMKTMLGISLEASCSDRRDKIYGLLGIIDCSDMPNDYSKGLFEAYCDMIQYIKDPEVRGPLGDQDWLVVS